MEEVKLYDKEEKHVMMKIWSVKELKEGIELKINLPGFGKDDIKELKAEMKNGLLKIYIPKKVEEKNVIPVKVE
ncbi:hypothetical protein C5167_049885 [Papaver somniferum]|uniref:SHSP domain-containing protein n=1 Tax=Papaver somniferum TaxID=3469 RepID=A0A4Y7KNG7_PAPSO|nr:hypothetical protein C5167_049885 [Papaver somniferum]